MNAGGVPAVPGMFSATFFSPADTCCHIRCPRGGRLAPEVTHFVTSEFQSGTDSTCPEASARIWWWLRWAPISDITASTSPGLMWVM